MGAFRESGLKSDWNGVKMQGKEPWTESVSHFNSATSSAA